MHHLRLTRASASLAPETQLQGQSAPTPCIARKRLHKIQHADLKWRPNLPKDKDGRQQRKPKSPLPRSSVVNSQRLASHLHGRRTGQACVARHGRQLDWGRLDVWILHRRRDRRWFPIGSGRRLCGAGGRRGFGWRLGGEGKGFGTGHNEETPDEPKVSSPLTFPEEETF